MILMCWSRTVECKMATRSYLGFTVKATKAAFYGTSLQYSALFVLGSYTYNSPAYCLQE